MRPAAQDWSWRYTRDTQQAEFLEALWNSSLERHREIDEGSLIWRAHIGNHWQPEQVGDTEEEFPCPFSPERMKPLHDRSTEGRANAKGIPHLYLSTVRGTAIAEVRPWLGVYVSVGQFKVVRKLTVVNCTGNNDLFTVYFEEPDALEKQRAVWRDIDEAFSKPITPSEDAADYVPTQVVAELFRARGLDGIGYRSSLGPGHNIVLFDLDAADLVNCSLFEEAGTEAGTPSQMTLQIGQGSRYLVRPSGR